MHKETISKDWKFSNYSYKPKVIKNCESSTFSIVYNNFDETLYVYITFLESIKKYDLNFHYTASDKKIKNRDIFLFRISSN